MKVRETINKFYDKLNANTNIICVSICIILLLVTVIFITNTTINTDEKDSDTPTEENKDTTINAVYSSMPSKIVSSVTSIDTDTSAKKSDVDLSMYNIAPAVSSINPYNGTIDIFTDLESRVDISEQDLNKVIEYWTAKYPDSLFRGSADAFIYASQITGLDPIFLVSLAGQESGWDINKLNKTYNPYSINIDGFSGYVFGDSFEEGIINGAIWIRNQLYDNAGAHTLYDMQYGVTQYATDTNWMADISSIMDDSYKVLLGGI